MSVMVDGSRKTLVCVYCTVLHLRKQQACVFKFYHTRNKGTMQFLTAQRQDTERLREP